MNRRRSPLSGSKPKKQTDEFSAILDVDPYEIVQLVPDKLVGAGPKVLERVLHHAPLTRTEQRKVRAEQEKFSTMAATIPVPFSLNGLSEAAVRDVEAMFHTALTDELFDLEGKKYDPKKHTYALRIARETEAVQRLADILRQRLDEAELNLILEQWDEIGEALQCR